MIVIGTGNEHKVRELGEILTRAAPGLRVVGLADLPGAPFDEPKEGSESFEANARLKAVTYARATGHACLADDSGLEIDALGGRPGVISSHYCTDGRETGMTREQRDASNIRRVLEELDGVAPEKRSARFVCFLALAEPDGTVRHLTRGTLEGRIGTPPDVPRGDGGFGYDPIFLAEEHDHQRTCAELDAHEKHRLSHRGHAAHAMSAWITDNLGTIEQEAST